MNREQVLHRRIKLATWFFIFGLVLSGATAIPLRSELDWLTKLTEAHATGDSGSFLMTLNSWLVHAQIALQETGDKFPFLFYGTDWLAFGHFAIAIAFIGALRDPVRNVWLFTFGMITCVLVVPYALVCGAIRGIPFWWRLIDCSFGVIGFIPLWFCRQNVRELETLKRLV